ncbi:hypothetical protein RRG08_026621 [Elysia crispata]|uniref:Uncharacterized protein n=1 Tax=Elysia crispata TaxID=231223 RepID=A0AAE1E6M9_9GAST|nr:hypothetical protein RRG08_026621 [Elysia crispata]
MYRSPGCARQPLVIPGRPTKPLSGSIALYYPADPNSASLLVCYWFWAKQEKLNKNPRRNDAEVSWMGGGYGSLTRSGARHRWDSRSEGRVEPLSVSVTPWV